MALLQEAASHSSGEERFVLETDWRGYGKILEAVGERHVLVTYDGGRLELLSPSPEHEMAKSLFGSLVETLLDETATAYLRGGSITFRRRAIDKGLEPDDCFWISNWSAMIDVKRWRPNIHPPPDLVIEIEVSQSIVKRLPILAALGVPEVWRWRDEQVTPLRLHSNGQYEPLESSLVVPRADFGLLTEHMLRAGKHNTFEVKRSFRARLEETAT